MMKLMLSLAATIGTASSKSTINPLMMDKSFKYLADDDDWITSEFMTKLDNWNESSKEFGLRYWENNSTW